MKTNEMEGTHHRVGNDPLEQQIAHALDAAGIDFLTDHEGEVPLNLDFYLPKYNLFLEVKGGHSPRIADQMKRDSNVIAIQGVRSVAFIVELILGKEKP